MAAHRLAENLAVKGGHTFHVAGGNAKDGTNGVGGTVGYPATLLLDNFQRFNGGGTRVFVVLHFLLDGGAFGVAERETVGFNQRSHNQRSTSAITKSMLPR